MSIEVTCRDGLNHAIDFHCRLAIKSEHPAQFIPSSYNGGAQVMLSRWMGRERIDSFFIDFDIGDEIFKISRAANQRLLDAGLLVLNEFLVGATHSVTIVHGTWVGTGKPVLNRYMFKGDDTAAVLMAIKHGGRLNKLQY